MPYRRGSSDLLWPDRHQLLITPLDHDWRRNFIKTCFIELNRCARHRLGPASFEASTMQRCRHILRLRGLCALQRLAKHVETCRALNGFVHHKKSRSACETVL